MSANLFLQYLSEGWIQYFGRPNVLRLDPAGAFRSKEVETFCDQHGIFLDVIPGEAHWHLGTCEQAVKGLKEVLTKLVEQEEDVSVELALAEAVRTFNCREIIRGYSPIQHVLGKAPDETGRFVSSLTGQATEVLLGNPQGELVEDIERMKKAEQALAEWQAQQKITKAMNSRSQPKRDYRPGDLVYFWRKQISGQPAGKNGRFLGPARILATETKREADGSLRKGSAVWCVRGRRLLKCCPEQLRPASLREEVLEELEQEEPEAPWTFPRVASELGGNEFIDISAEVPDVTSWHQAQDPMEVEPPTRRHRRKRPASEPRNAGSDERQRRSRQNDPSHLLWAEAKPWWEEVTEEAFQASAGEHLWEQESAMVEVAIDMPETNRGMRRAIENLEAFFVNSLKRRNVEVSEKRMTPDEYRQFQEAKQKEVKNFIAARAFEALPAEMRPNREQAIGMRWILTWKKQEDGSQKAKARAILKGFQDPNYENRSTTTPVMTRQTRQMLLQLAAWRRWRVKKGDVSGAFLQGREYPNELYCIPCPEILEAMGLKPNEVLRVKRGCYGLVDAPLEWYRTISEFLESLGLVKSWADPCAWLWKPDGKTRGMIAGHVDDFLFAGDPKDPAWLQLEAKIKERFKWQDWEEGRFVQCGVLVEEQPDGSYHLSQPDYLDKISEINVSSSRRKDRKSPTTEHEKTQLRAVLGALSWHSQQVSPHTSAEVGLMLSEVCNSTVETIFQVNKMLYNARCRKDHKLIIHSFPPETKLGLFVWADARIDRVARSPGAAETIAVVNGEDYLFHARYQLGEILQAAPNVFDVDETVNHVEGCVISDSRNVYDKLMTEELSVKGAEKRSDLELLCLKSAQRNNNVVLRKG
eukprot:s526_g21.t1